MKLRHIAISAALAAAAPAFAAIAPGNVSGVGTGTGDSEMFFVAYDSVAKASYALDLGVFQSTFRSIADGNEGGYSRTWTFGTNGAQDPTYFSQFASQTAQANWRWSVQGYDNIGLNTANGKSLSTTVTNGQSITDTIGQSVGATQNNVLTTGLNAYDNFLGNSNDFGSHAPFNDYTINGADVSTSAVPVTYALTVQNMGNNGNGLYPFTTDNGFGESARYVYLTRSSTSNLSSALVLTDQFNNSAGIGTFTFGNGSSAGQYTLTYSLAAAVPEPQTYALMLAGVGCLLLLSRRRRTD